jgi:two-component system, cell cycle response regulator DivK
MLPNEQRKQLIMLVEDMVEPRELYAGYLEYAGFSVVTAINGHEAIRLARLLRPDLILMDIRLPGMDGLEATSDIKSDPDLAHIPIVAMTGDSSNDVVAQARRAGCAGIITKPVFPDEVARKIMSVLATVRSSDS